MPVYLASVSLVGGAFFIAVEGDGLPSWAQILIAIGVAAGLVTKQLVPGWIYADAKNQLEALREDMKEMTKSQIEVYQKESVSLSEASRALDKAGELTTQVMAELRVYRSERGAS